MRLRRNLGEWRAARCLCPLGVPPLPPSLARLHGPHLHVCLRHFLQELCVPLLLLGDLLHELLDCVDSLDALFVGGLGFLVGLVVPERRRGGEKEGQAARRSEE